MSIFSRMKEKKAQDMGQEPQQAQPQPVQQPAVYQQPQVQEPAPIQNPKPVPQVRQPVQQQQQPQPQQPTFKDKVTTQEVREEIVEVSDDEKVELMDFYVTKERNLRKDVDAALARFEDMKIKEKRAIDADYQRQIKQIEDKYEQKKQLILREIAPKIERYRALSDKFKVPLGGGMQYENKNYSTGSVYESHKRPEPTNNTLPGFKPYSIGQVPGPEIDESSFSPERAGIDPEISRILRDLDNKYK